MRDWRYELDKRKTFTWLWMARRVPQRLAYWVYIVQGIRAMNDTDIVPEVTYSELLHRMTE